MLERCFSPRTQGISFEMGCSEEPWVAAVLGAVLENRGPGLSGCPLPMSREKHGKKFGKGKGGKIELQG